MVHTSFSLKQELPGKLCCFFLWQEMASDELKEMRKNLTKEAIREHQMAKTGGTQTDLFTCGKCKKKNCTYTQVCGYLGCSFSFLKAEVLYKHGQRKKLSLQNANKIQSMETVGST